ncbi:MAG: hypothetical protein ACRD2J_12155 [Thermoanaerobaculia bacterium]
MRKFAPLLVALVATLAQAQDLPVVEETIVLESERPEAWAMKYFAGVTLLTAGLPPEARAPGSFSVAFELITIPQLSERQRTVGFNGIKEEDLDKLPLMGRGRIIVGLPLGLEATLGWVPPLEIRGVESNLVSGSLARAFAVGAATDVWLRAFAQTGDVEGSFTCFDEVLAFPPTSPGNPFGCEELSSDVYSVDYFGGEVGIARQLRAVTAPRVHLALLAANTDTEFQVDAIRSGFLDRTLLLHEGSIVAATAGASWSLPGGLGAGLEVVWVPLEIRRPESSGAEDDPLVNVRVLLGYDF